MRYSDDAPAHDVGEDPREGERKRIRSTGPDCRWVRRPVVHARDARDGADPLRRDRDREGLGPDEDRGHVGPLGPSADAGDREDASNDPGLLPEAGHPTIPRRRGPWHRAPAHRGARLRASVGLGDRKRQSYEHGGRPWRVRGGHRGDGHRRGDGDRPSVAARPETIRVDVRGTLGRCTGAKDVILKVIGTTGDDGARYAAVEFAGPTVGALPMNERFVLCNMTTEMGAKVGMIAADEATKRYLAHTGRRFEPIRSDDDATFVQTFTFDVDGMGPQVACPSNPANLKPVEDVEGTKIDVAFLGSCTNARIEDLRIAAGLLKGERVARGVRFQITPASQIIYRQALKEGLIEIFMDAGATFTSSTCGPCFGGHLGTLAGHAVSIASP